MKENYLDKSITSGQKVYLIIAIMLVSTNLRPGITSVGPLLGIIREKLDLENWSIGMFAAIPLITFAIMAPLTPKIAVRLGNIRTAFIGLVILFVGISVRSVPLTTISFIGASLIGLGIAIINVLLPAIIKSRFPQKIGQLTSLYSTIMLFFAALSSGFSLPLAQMGLGWEWSLFFWSVLALIAIIALIPVYTLDDKVNDINVQKDKNEKVGKVEKNNLLKSPLAWNVTLFMGLQSYCFFAFVSWLPEILQSRGFSSITSGWLLSYSQFVGLFSTFLVPIVAGKYPNQQKIVGTVGLAFILGVSGIILGKSKFILVIAVTFIGVSAAASISLALVFFGMRTQNEQQASELSGMAQSIGYVFAALGPLVTGILYDWFSSWELPLTSIIIVIILMLITGLKSAENKRINIS